MTKPEHVLFQHPAAAWQSALLFEAHTLPQNNISKAQQPNYCLWASSMPTVRTIDQSTGVLIYNSERTTVAVQVQHING